MLEQACLNEARRPDNRWLGRWWGADYTKGEQREEVTTPNTPLNLASGHHQSIFKNFGAENSYSCITDLFHHEKLGFFLSVKFSDNLPAIKKVKPNESINSIFDQENENWVRTPNLMLYPRSKKLSSIASR